MSREARPISPTRFAQAIEDLPLENIYMKAHEINNSVMHLRQSNAQLQEYSDSIKNDESLDAESRQYGDKDCLEAIEENKVVIERQLGRISLLKAEVERRGGRWHEGEMDSEKDPAATAATNGSNVPSATAATTLPAHSETEQGENTAVDGDEGLHL